jgi:hypothetical protein
MDSLLLWVNVDQRALEAGDATEIANRVLKAPFDEQQFLRARLGLLFPSVDDDPRPNWSIPNVRRFYANLDKLVPHFAFYLVDEPGVGQVRQLLMALADLQQLPGGVVASADFPNVVDERLRQVVAFGETVEIDPKITRLSFLVCLPPTLMRDDPAAVRRFLRLSRRAVAQVQGDMRRGNQSIPEELRPLIYDAASLLDLDAGQFETERAFINAIFEKMGPLASGAELRAFDDAFEAASVRIGGTKRSLPVGSLRAAVRENEAGAYGFVEGHIGLAASQPRYLKSAFLVSAAIELEFGDRRPSSRVEARAEALGVSMADLQPDLKDGP